MLISATRRREAEAIVDRVRYIELTAHPGFSDIYISADALVGDPVSTSVHRQDLPIVGITLGDVAGIGPEVVVRALARDDVKASCRPLVIGDRRVLEEPRFAAQGLCFQAVEDISQADWSAYPVVVLDVHVVDPRDVTVGRISPVAGRAAVQFVLKATALALEGAIDAVATAPLNKEAMRLAGYDYIGHTEILADVTHTAECTTMLATPGLRVTHVTRHIPFREIAAAITAEAVLDTITVTDEGMRTLGYAHPRLAVAGLNPHNGDGGLIGDEEITVIGPAVRAAAWRGGSMPVARFLPTRSSSRLSAVTMTSSSQCTTTRGTSP